MMNDFLPVILESPFSGDRALNINFLGLCIRDSIMRNESPYASHCIGTLGLDDNDPKSRDRGITAGLAWRKLSRHTVAYMDLGYSRGMELGVVSSLQEGHQVDYRLFLDGPEKPASVVMCLYTHPATGLVCETPNNLVSRETGPQDLKKYSSLTPETITLFQALQKFIG